MERPFSEIVDMHSKLSNDPWLQARLTKRLHNETIRSLENDKRKASTLDWYSKSNSSKQMDQFRYMQMKECELLQKLENDKLKKETMKNTENLEKVFSHLLERDKNTELFKDRYAQYLRENDPQLRVLATQLREAYVNKIRLAQMDEKEKMKSDILKADIPYVKALEKRIQEDQEKEKYAQLLEDEKKYLFRKQLEAQIKEKAVYDSINDTTEDDKRRIEAVTQANMQELQLEKEREFLKKMNTRHSLLSAIELKQREVEENKIKLKEEEEKLNRYLKMADNRSNEQKKLKDARQQSLENVQKQLGDLLWRKEKDIEEFEQARQDVAIAQSEMAAFQHEKKEQEERAKAKLEYINELNKFQESRLAAEQKEKEKDRELNRKIELIEQEKIEKYLKEKELEAKKHELFKEECQKDIINRKQEKEECHELDLQRLKDDIEAKKKYDDDVAKERANMIKEMAPHLYPGCIPRGMLSAKDLELLDDPLKAFLASKKSYPDLDDFC